MPKITGLGAGAAPANTDVLVLVSNTAGTANTQKVTVNTFFSNVTANVKFANAEITVANIVGGVVNASAVTATTVKGTTSVQTPLIEFTDGDDAMTIADGGAVTIPNLIATTADINGGTVDNVTIGQTTPVTLYATGGNLQGVDVGTSSQAVGTFTNLTSLANTDLQGGLTIGHEEITSNGAISTYVPLTILKGAAGVVVATLANSANMGQLKIITAYHTNATTSLEVASTLGAGDTYTFQTSGETIMLIWTGDHWALISKSGNPTGSNLAGTMDVT
jgi:hypothetical protein